MSSPIAFVTAGLLVGVLVGLTGVGGGSMMTPILVLLFGQSPVVAVGTDLLFSASTKIAATLSFGYSRRIDWAVVRRLAIGSIPGTLLVLAWFWSMRAGPSVAVNRIILECLATMLIVTSAGMLYQALLRRPDRDGAIGGAELGDRTSGAPTVIVGLVLGIAVTLTSVGAGALGTVALLFLYPRRLAGSRLVGTDIAHALPVTLIAGIGHGVLGHVNFPVLGYLLLGSVPGVLIASRAAIRLPQAITRILIGTMLAVVGVRVLAGILSQP